MNALEKKIIDQKLSALLVSSVKDYAIFMIDTNGYVLSWNRGAEAIKGYSEDEIIGRHISVFYLPEDVERDEPSANLALALARGSLETEGWRVRKNGNIFWANVVFTPLFDDYKNHIGFAKITRDITENKLLADEKASLLHELESRVKTQRQKIKTDESLFRKLIENSHDGITLLDKDFNVTYRSLSAQRINGWSDPEQSGTCMAELIHPDDEDILTDLKNMLFKRPFKPVVTTFRLRHRQGNYIWIEGLFTNMLDDDDIHAIVCNFKDVTDEKRSQQEIIQKNRQIEDILERITDGFIALDENFCYSYANKQVGEMLGRQPSSLIGKNVWEEFPDAVNSNTYHAILKAFNTQQYTYCEDFYAPLSLWQENHIYPSKRGVSIFIRDISERKVNEEQLRRQHEQLQHAADTQCAILNALPPPIALIDEKGIIRSVNEAWRQFVRENELGLSDDGLGSNYFRVSVQKIINSDQYISITKGIKEVIAGKRTLFMKEYPCHTPTKQRWFQLVAAPVDGQKQAGAVVLHVDITARKLAENSLLNSQANLRSVFENTDLSVILFDCDMKIIDYNRNAKELFWNRQHQKLRRGNLAFLYFKANRKTTVQEQIEKVKQGEAINYEVFYDFADNAGGAWYDVRWNGIFDKKQEPIGIILTLKDITLRKEQSDEISRQNNVLREISWIGSHEIRRPVASIMGLTNLIKEARDMAEKEEIISLINVCANDLDKLIHIIDDKVNQEL